MKIKNIAFFGVMASILSVAGAHAATTQTIIASKNYVDGKITGINTTLGETYATKTYANTAASNAQAAAEQTAATDATSKANAARTGAVADVKTNLENTTTPVYDINAKSLKVNGSPVLTGHQDISGKADTDLGNITTAGNTVIQNQAKSVAANGTFSASTNYGTGTIGAAIKSKADTSAIPTKTSQLTNDSSFATTTQVATAKSEAISAAASDATAKADAKVSSATTISADSTTTAPNEKAVSTALAGKQATLSTTQLAAANSGITSTKVSKYDGYESTIASKADASALTNKANTALDNLSDTGKANVSAQGTYSATATYGTGTVGAAIKSKADSSTLTSHTENGDIHVTAAQKTAWTNKQNAITSTNPLPAANVSGLATVATSGKASDLNNDAGFLKAADISGKADKATNLAASGTTNKIVQYNAQGIIVAGTTAGSAATKNATDSYVATGTDVTTGKAVAAALGTLDVDTITTSGKPIVSVGETDGKITAAAGNINVSSVNGPTASINGGTATCSAGSPCVLSYDGENYSWTNFVY